MSETGGNQILGTLVEVTRGRVVDERGMRMNDDDIWSCKTDM
jgi:hypothetical protein